jgi:glyoxylase-like metal-dependent hydrolase (beta-lactamase superfamily II)
MAETLAFDRTMEPRYGTAVAVAPRVRRITAPNPGPFTFRGTNSYIVGSGQVAVIDPGPDADAHLAALLAATEGEAVSHIFVTHTHRDHSSLVPRLKAATGATTVGGGPHRLARRLLAGEANRLDAGADTAFVPDLTLADEGFVDGDGWRLTAVPTPGHAANHLSFALAGSNLLFSGDHVMGWSTTVVAPPDGAMADYMASLDRLLARDERRYLPGHGGPVEDARAYVRALRSHRRMREAAILDRLAKGDRTILELVAAIYRDTDPRLHGAAALSVLAHLEDLVARGKAVSDGPPRIDGRFAPA